MNLAKQSSAMHPLPTTRQKRLSVPRAASGAEHSLAEAFTSFTQVASSLEISYAQLQTEIAKLHRELERTNNDLSGSLKENERMRAELESIMEGLPCGVVVVNASGKLRLANPAARRLVHLERFLAELPTESFEGERELAVPHPDGPHPDGPHDLAVTQALLPTSPAAQDDRIFILRDTTEQKQYEREREVTHRAQALAEMAMLLAHEIRNPLGSLELFAGLLADATQNEPEVQQWVTHLQAGLRTLAATVNNVLQFHSPPCQELASPNLVRLLRETVDFLRPLARQRGMRMEFATCQAEITILADPSRLQQVFFNLTLNAFRAMTPGCVLKVRVGWAELDANRQVEIDFEDQGAGIAEENLQKIFEPGFTTNPGSPGLGLAVCKKVIEQHHGSLRVHSSPGRGATFTITLPGTGVTR